MGEIVSRIQIPPIEEGTPDGCCIRGTIQDVSLDVNATGIRDRDTNAPMDSPAKRLKWLREKRRFKSAAEASQCYNWTDATYRSHENGTRDLTKEAALQYATAFGANPGWLLYGGKSGTPFGKYVEGKEYDPLDGIAWRRVPVLDISMLSTEPGLQSAISQAKEFIAVPDEEYAGHLTFAHRLSDDSMLNPLTGDGFRPGEIVILDGSATISPGDYVQASLQDGRGCLFRQYRLGGKNGDGDDMVILVPINPNYPMEHIVPGKTGAIIGRLICHHRRY